MYRYDNLHVKLPPPTYDNTMARSIDLEPEQEEEGRAEIWDSDRVANATGTETAEYITDKINDYSQRGLRGVDLFTY